MVALNKCRLTYGNYCICMGQRDGVRCALSGHTLLECCEGQMHLYVRIPDTLAGAKGNQVAIACFDTEAKVEMFIRASFVQV